MRPHVSILNNIYHMFLSIWGSLYVHVFFVILLHLKNVSKSERKKAKIEKHNEVALIINRYQALHWAIIITSDEFRDYCLSFLNDIDNDD